jgi:hypothetical protein
VIANVLQVLGLASIVYAAFLGAPIVGFVVLGFALVLLSLPAQDVKIPRPRLKLRRRK